MSVASSHPIDSKKSKGISLLKKIIPKGLLWHYVLVVPKMPAERVKVTSVTSDWNAKLASVHIMMADLEL